MIRFIFFVIYNILVFFATLLSLLPWLVLLIFRRFDLQYQMMGFIAQWPFAWMDIKLSGSKVQVKGLENLPVKKGICFVANHEGYFDILLVLAYIPFQVGFIAKKSLDYFPFLGLYMRMIGCILIDRKNFRKAMKTLEKGSQMIRNGNNMLIFPEGTRSRGKGMKELKPGSLRLAVKADAIIVPLSLSGTSGIFEANSKKGMAPSRLKMTIHPPIYPDAEDYKDKIKLTNRVQEIIKQGLEEQKSWDTNN